MIVTDDFLSSESKGRRPSPLSALTWKYNASTHPGLISLAGGFPNSELFPINNLSFATDRASFSIEKYSLTKTTSLNHQAYQNVISSDIDLSEFLQYSPPGGHPRMLDQCKRFVEALHTPKYGDWDVLVNSGGGDAIEKAFSLLCDPGDFVLVERYSYPATLELIRSRGYHAVAIDMDKEGLMPLHMLQILRGTKAKVLYTIPSGQNPMGCTQSTERRREIYKIAQDHGIVIIEDDPYAMLTMPDYVPHTSPARTREEYVDSLPISYLSLDIDGRVLHLNSFSKLFSPGMRIGYTVAHHRFIERTRQHVSVTTRHANGMAQAMLTATLQQWGVDGWLDWCFDIAERYVARRAVILDELQPFVASGWINIDPPECGMFVVVYINFTKDRSASGLQTLFERSIQEGVLIVPGDVFASDPSREAEVKKPFVRLTYASPTHDDLRQGIKRFGKALEYVCT